MAILALPGYGQWYLAFVAWTPLLMLLLGAPRRWAILGFWAAGFLYFLGSLYWLLLVTAIGWVALAFYLSLYFLLFAVLCRWLSTGKPHVPFVLGAPVIWVAMEFLRSATWTGPDWFLFTGLPWQLAGHPLYRQLPMIQIADLTGVYGISFLVIAVNAVLASVMVAWLQGGLSDHRRRWGVVAAAIFVSLLVAGDLIYGCYRLAQYKPREGPRICVVQGNVPQDLKVVAGWNKLSLDELRDAANRVRSEMLQAYMTVTRTAQDQPRDILVWPETTVPGPIEEDAASFLAVQELCRMSHSYVLVGATRDAGDGIVRQWRNSVYYYAPSATLIGTYDKLHLVPFGEYIPMVGRFPWLRHFMPPGYIATCTPGTEMVLFSLPGPGDRHWTFGTPVCFEDTMPYLIRRFRRRGADFIVNLTNDGWFRGSYEMDQHLAISAFRAVENRIGVVRAANTGISAFIEPSGRIQLRLTDARGHWREVAGTLSGRVLTDTRETFYTRQEDVFAVTCLGWTLILAAFKPVVTLARPALRN